MRLSASRTWANVWAAVFVALLPWSAAAASPWQAQPEAASGWHESDAVSAPQAMVVTANPHASAAALAALREGGHAVDAAIAAALVLNVVEPQSSGIGGGAFLMLYDETAGIRAWDGRESAPMTVDESLFLDDTGASLPFFDAVRGGRGVGVPGLLALFETVHERHGRLPWARLFEPAIELAEAGFPVSPRLHRLLAGDRFLAANAAARALFFDADGTPLAVGEQLRNPELARTLRAVAERGAEAFYRGEIAADIVAEVGRGLYPGRLSLDDLAAYEPLEREPLCAPFRSYRVCGMPPPSAGGGVVGALLGVYERLAPVGLDPEAPEAVHFFAEAGRLAYADRDAWYGAPETMSLAPEALFAPAYLDARAALVRPDTSLGRAPAGEPGAVPAPPATTVDEQPSTTHLSIVDATGNAVSLTASVESAFGSRRMVRGFMLNNQLTDFAFQPKGERGPHPNRPGPDRRPLSSMAPTLVFDEADRLHALTGSPGGSRILNYVAASLVGLLDGAMPPEEVVARVHAGSRNGPTEIESGAQGDALAAALTALGHEVVRRDMTSGVALIVRDGAGWRGAADPRREGVAAGF